MDSYGVDKGATLYLEGTSWLDWQFKDEDATWIVMGLTKELLAWMVSLFFIIKTIKIIEDDLVIFFYEFFSSS